LAQNAAGSGSESVSPGSGTIYGPGRTPDHVTLVAFSILPHPLPKTHKTDKFSSFI